MRPYTFLVPKPMLPVGPKPILEHIIDWLRKNGIREVIISTGYLGKMIQDYFGDGERWGVSIDYATSSRPLGIAGQLKSAEPKVEGRFVCLYGDAILEFDLAKVLNFHLRHRALATAALMKYSTGLKYGFLDTDREGRLTAWREKPTITGYINVGCYAMEKEFLKFVPAGRVYGMRETFEKARKAGARLYAVKVKGRFTDIGDRRSYREANEEYVKRMGKLL